MKALFVSATALMLVAGPALAQETPAPPPPPAPGATSPAEAPPPPPAEIAPAPGAEAPPPPDEMRPERNRDRAERGRDRHHWRHGGRDRGPRPPMGARFSLDVGSDGEMKLDVRCAPAEPMQACAEIVNNLLDRLSQSNESESDL